MPNLPSDDRLEQRAKNVLLHQLSRSMKTRFQLSQILEKREIPKEIAERALDRFVEAQLIDDAEFARAFVASRLASGGKSKAAISRELRQKGVAADLVQAAVDHLDSEKELELATNLVARRAQRMEGLEPQARYRRLSGFLQRKGFSSGIVTSVLRNL